MTALKILCLLLVFFLIQHTSAEGPSSAFTLKKCLDVSSKLADSLKHTLLGLKARGKETPVAVDCLDLQRKGVNEDGVYNIFPDGKKIAVYCDMETDGGGWTVIQRRVNGLVDFYRGWKDYKRGFGNLKDSFWLGLENIHTLTSFDNNTSSSLRVDMWIPKEYRYEKYTDFKIGNIASSYKLSVSNASGSAGDSLGPQNTFKFTTFDKDHDSWTGNCAVTFKGAWWYDTCHKSNLNGLYLNGVHKDYATGINWHSWKGFYFSLQKVEMKVRRNM